LHYFLHGSALRWIYQAQPSCQTSGLLEKPPLLSGEVSIGDTFGSAVTVTETHLVVAAGLFGDFNPLHVDESYASRTRFGGRILHGACTSALMSAPIGMSFYATAIA